MRQRLESKGWSSSELDDLFSRFSPPKEAFHALIIILVLLLPAIILVPFIYVIFAAWASIIVPPWLLYVILLLLGVFMGGLFGILLVDLERLEHRHHASIIAFIPVLSLIGAGLLGFWTQYISVFDLIPASLLYAISFCIPYTLLVKKIWH